MNVRQLTVSLTSSAVPIDFHLDRIIEAFHGWIRDERIEEIIPIDVGDYRHLSATARVLLVAHHGILSLQRERDGKLTLSWGRRRDAAGPLEHRLGAGLAVLLKSVDLLESELEGLRFDRKALGIEVTSRWIEQDAEALGAAVTDALATHRVIDLSARRGRGPVAVRAVLERDLVA